MTLKQKALLQTVGMFSGAIVVSILINFIIKNVPVDIICNILGVGFITFFAYMFYQITLSRLEYNEKLKDLNDKG